MDLKSRRELLRLRTGEAAARFGESRARAEDLKEDSPRPGQTFVFQETRSFPVEWLFLERDAASPQRALTVPADDFPLVGSRDVAVSDSEGGSLHIRCGHGVLMDVEAFMPNLRTGVLDSEALEQARGKWAEIAEGTFEVSLSEEEVESDQEYVRWMKMLSGAQVALPGNSLRAISDDLRKQLVAPAIQSSERPVLGRRWWNKHRIGFALAAIFAAAAVGLSFWIGRLRAELYRPALVGISSAQEIVFGEVDRSIGRLSFSAKATHMFVYLVLSKVESHSAYLVRLVDADKEEIVWESAVVSGDSELLMLVPRRLLNARDFRIQLLGSDEGKDMLLLDERAVRINFE